MRDRSAGRRGEDYRCAWEALAPQSRYRNRCMRARKRASRSRRWRSDAQHHVHDALMLSAGNRGLGGPRMFEGVEPMGRGRAKAKQVKVARQLKYNSGGTDLDRLRTELGVGEGVRDNNSDHASSDTDHYSDFDDLEEEEDDEAG